MNWETFLQDIILISIGGLIGYFSALRTAKYQEKQNQKKLLLSKLEEIYEILSNISLVFTSQIFKINNFLSLGQLPTIDLELKDKNFSIEKLNMLINFYGPDLKEELKHLYEHVEQYNKVTQNILYQSLPNQLNKDNIFSKDNINTLLNIGEKFSLTCDEIKKQVIVVSKKYL